MRTFFVSIVAMTAALAVSTSANAGCQRVSAVGDAFSKDLATIMSTHGLTNILDGKGLTGKGPVHTRCTSGGMFGAQCQSTQTGCTGKS